VTFNLRNALIEMHAIRNADEPYLMYFDETNNIAKLRLNEGRFNVTDNVCFALGGVATLNPVPAPTLGFLTKLLGVQSNVKELKRQHIGKGGFEDIIASSKVQKLLDWLMSQNYFLHYQIIDPLYWGIVDTIDSIVMEIEIKPEQMFFLGQKSKADLHLVIQKNLSETEHIFSTFEYPNITTENISAFYKSLANMVEASNCLDPFHQKHLYDILTMGSKLDNLSVLGGEEKSTLLDSFDKFYAERIMLFKNAKIVFDNEDNVAKRLGAKAYEGIIGKNANYTFVNSKLDTHIQISDLIIGIIGKYFSYLNNNPIEDVMLFLRSLNPVQRHNMEVLNILTDRSDLQCNAFFHYVTSEYLNYKNRKVWQYIGYKW